MELWQWNISIAVQHPETLPETIKQVTRLATVDMRVDYLAPGRGKYFIARAEVLRLGRKGVPCV